MKQKILSLLLALSMAALTGCAELDAVNDIVQLPELTQTDLMGTGNGQTDTGEPDAPEDPTDNTGTVSGEDGALWEGGLDDLDENGTYNSKEDVSLYLHRYDRLPDNYITKSEARDLGWTGGSVETYAPGCAIGGDRFGNREGLLPDASGRSYYECDIDTIGKSSRGAKRIIFSNDGLIYYTEDHYESFTLLYGEE